MRVFNMALKQIAGIGFMAYRRRNHSMQTA